VISKTVLEAELVQTEILAVQLKPFDETRYQSIGRKSSPLSFGNVIDGKDVRQTNVFCFDQFVFASRIELPIRW
jgi:hypothetical protein